MLIVLRRSRQGVTEVEIIVPFFEMNLDVFLGMMILGGPGESFRSESGCLDLVGPVSTMRPANSRGLFLAKL
jgi:hypothetical protein